MIKLKIIVLLLFAGFSIVSCTSSNKTNDADSTMMMDDRTMHDTSDMKMGADTTRNDSMMVDTMNR